VDLREITVPPWQNFFASYGPLIAGGFAVGAAIVGIISAFASNELAEKSNSDLKRAAAIIERLEKQVSTVIGDEWAPLDTEQVEKLRSAIATVPIRGTIQVMYLNAFGKSFAQSLATAFRAAQWEVRFSTGGGFEAGVEVGRGKSSKLLIGALAEVIDPKVLVNIGADEESNNNFFFIGVGSKPAH
jgi:hypothetical protein